MTHTPTPWNARGLAICKGNSLIAVMGQDDGIKFSEKTSLANATHIVKCVNLHDELVDALELLIDNISPEAWEALPHYVQEQVMQAFNNAKTEATHA